MHCGSDFQLRILGIDRSAAATLPALEVASQNWVDAFSAGVNAWLNNPATALPADYNALFLIGAEPWTALDSVIVSKDLAFGRIFDLADLDNTAALLAFQNVGAQQGFDGSALFAEDFYRSPPFAPAVTLAPPLPAENTSIARAAASYLNAGTQRLPSLASAALAAVAKLRGIARSGGFNTVDAASHSVRADGVNNLTFGSVGPDGSSPSSPPSAHRCGRFFRGGSAAIWPILLPMTSSHCGSQTNSGPWRSLSTRCPRNHRPGRSRLPFRPRPSRAPWIGRVAASARGQNAAFPATHNECEAPNRRVRGRIRRQSSKELLD